MQERAVGFQIDFVALIVDEYRPTITFFTDVLALDLVEDSPSLTSAGRPERWASSGTKGHCGSRRLEALRLMCTAVDGGSRPRAADKVRRA
ncbi:hypothetical protein Xph01_10480 [Micromonospora phaseoli]|nr:hypothetical protein Xph01_10480 [Micromonospora phaseoli]